MNRITITETRFEKIADSTLEISGFLGNISIDRKDESKAVVRISQIGDEFTVYYKAYSNTKKTIRNLYHFETIEEAVLKANEFTTLFITHGFKITSIN